MLSPPEQKVLATFRQFLMTPHQMLCFWGPALDRHRKGLRLLECKELVEREKRAGGYCLTQRGYELMQRGDHASTASGDA